MLSPTSPVAIKPSLRRGDGLPFAGEQGQRQVKIYDLRKEPVIKIRDMRKEPTKASGAAATTVVVVPEVPDKKKRKRVATAARVAVKAKKRDQRTAAARFEKYEEEKPRKYWDISDRARPRDLLEEALQPKRQKEAYITVLNEDNHVSVLHSLVRLEVELRPSGPVKGKIAAFVGEVRPGSATPNLVVFEEESEIFASAVFPMVNVWSVVEHYQKEKEYFPSVVDMISEDNEEQEAQIRHCAPIPSKWVPLFLDEPSLRIAVARLGTLVDGLTKAEVDHYAPFIGMLATAACARDNISSISTAAIDVSKLIYKGKVKAFAEELWCKQHEPDKNGDDDESQDEESDPDPPSKGEGESDTDTDDEDGSDPTARHRNGAESQQPNAVTPPTTRASEEARWQQQTAQFCDAMMKMNANNMKSMIEAMMATTAAAGATGTPVSKMSPTRRTVLEACAGYNNDQEEFELPELYADIESAGWTADSIYTALRRQCVGIPGSRHRSKVHVTKKMVATMKSGNLSATNDRTYDGCTAGVTPFAVPHLSPKLAHEDEVDYQAFEEATHKTHADNKKFMAGQKFGPPKDLSEVIRILNNYICWVEVMFGGECPHLLQVVRIRNTLDEDQDELGPALNKYLLMSILWKVHEDARRFFDKCEKWNHGEPLPPSTLRGTGDLLEYDQQVSKSLTCPFDDFFNENKKAPGGGGGGKSQKEKGEKDGDHTRPPQPTTNPTLPPLCVSAVNKLKKEHPGWTIPRFAKECGIATQQFVVGAKGGCTNYQLLGTCNNTKCAYKHVACTVTDVKQKEVAAKIFEGLKVIESKKEADKA